MGGIGLVVFIVIVGTDLDNPDRDGPLAGWPLVLTIAAIAAIGANVVGWRRDTAAPAESHHDPGGTPWSS